MSLATTNICAKVRLEIKAKKSVNREVNGKANGKPGKKDVGLMDFRRTR